MISRNLSLFPLCKNNDTNSFVQTLKRFFNDVIDTHFILKILMENVKVRTQFEIGPNGKTNIDL